MGNKAKISIITLTLNNERTIDEVLKAVVDWADELLILDCGSTDRTEEIARKYNANFIFRKFDGFGTQKNYAVEQAKNSWVFVVDADEVVTPELRDEILKTLQKPDYEGYMIPNTLVFMGKPLRFGREYKMPHLRLFNRKFGNYNDRQVHEDVELDGRIATLKNHVLHYSYADLTDFFNKTNHYSTRGAVELHKKGKKASLIKVITKFPISFFTEYLIRLNFLNGYRGFIWSLGQAIDGTLKYAKLREMNEKF
jgi:glycosyltransferase involved in cell wall biosynthesis